MVGWLMHKIDDGYGEGYPQNDESQNNQFILSTEYDRLLVKLIEMSVMCSCLYERHTFELFKGDSTH